jgi:hypothetical protein
VALSLDEPLDALIAYRPQVLQVAVGVDRLKELYFLQPSNWARFQQPWWALLMLYLEL